MKLTPLGRTAAATIATASIALGIPALEASTAQAAPTTHATVAAKSTVNISALQGNLKKLGYFSGTISGHVDARTTAAVKAYQKKHGWSPTGVINQKLADYVAQDAKKSTATKPAIDSRCLTGSRAICADKTARKLYYVYNHKVVLTVDARFGRTGMPTREGVFHVFRMKADYVSHAYGAPMPYSMFFSGGEAVHYSPDFAVHGYNSPGSHGCINLRDRKAAAWVYNHTHIGDKVVVYRSK